MRYFLSLVVVLLLVAVASRQILTARAAGAGHQTALPLPSDADIRAILDARLNNHPGLGIVVGLLDESAAAASQRRIVTAGHAGEAAGRALDGKTVFEIGSATKVFTSLLLADMVQHGEVALDDPVAKYLPPSVKMPSRDGRQITLVDLATHTSGLPRLPSNLTPADSENPYADYTVDRLYAFLSSYSLPRAIGAQYEYSNLGAGLLGHVLALRAGMGYEQVLTARVLKPLGLGDTCITLAPDKRLRFAVGYNSLGYVTTPWDLPSLAGAGALRSTADDLLAFVEANLRPRADRLGASIEMTHVRRHDAGSPVMDIGLAWHIRKTDGGEIIWHNGGTGGFHSFIGFDRKTQIAVVILHNSPTSVDDIGFHLLDRTLPIASIKAPAPPSHKEVVLAPAGLQELVGEYEMTPSVIISVTTDGGALFIQMTGQGRIRAFPESATRCFLKAVDAQIDFERNASGRVTGLVLHQNGRDIRATRRTR